MNKIGISAAGLCSLRLPVMPYAGTVGFVGWACLAWARIACPPNGATDKGMSMQANKIRTSAAAWILLLLLPATLPAATISYQYDALNRMVQVAYSDGRTIAYTYDPAGNRTRKSVIGELDTDGDGIPDVIDPDDDNDGVPDTLDAFPLDPSEWLDTDHDGIGNNADPDDDNDGVQDINDNCPLVANSDQADDDRNGIGNACDPNYRPFCTECLPSRSGWRAVLRP